MSENIKTLLCRLTHAAVHPYCMSKLKPTLICNTLFLRYLCCASQLQHLLVALEELRLGLEQALHDTLDHLPRLVLELLLRRAENLLEHADELGCEALNRGLVGFVC